MLQTTGMMSMMGLAFSPLTAVLPMWKIAVQFSPKMARMVFASARYFCSQQGS